MGPRPAAGLALAAAALAATPGEAGADRWRPHVREAAHYAADRRGDVAFAIRTEDGAWARGRRQFPSASLMKPILMGAHLRRRSVHLRPLRRSERGLLRRMIRRSDNAAASELVVRLGTRRLRRFGRRAGMRRFAPVVHPWGMSRVTAADQARLFWRLDSLLPRRHRGFAMRLLRRIVPSQRWGIARVRPRGWRLHFKGGWGSGTGWVDHQAALLTRGDRRISLAILTYGNPSHAYGKRTLRGVARRLLRGL